MNEYKESCKSCPMYRKARQPVYGVGPITSRLMTVGEAPGFNEDIEGIPFCGDAGAELDANFQRVKIFRPTTRITNVLKCRPPNNRDPKLDEIECCTQILVDEILQCRPKFVAALGRFATRFFLDTDKTMEYIHGIPYRTNKLSCGIDIPETTVIPCYHPALGLRKTEMMSHIFSDFKAVADVMAGKIKVREPRGPRTVDYRLVTDVSQLPDFHDHVAIDTEWAKGKPWCITFSVKPDQSYMVMADNHSCVAALQQWWSRKDVLCTIHNILYDILVLWQLEIYPTRYEDTMAMAYLLQTEPQGLKPLTYRFLNIEMQEYEDVVSSANQAKALRYFAEVMSREWPNADAIDRWVDGVYKPKYPSNIKKRIKKIVTDLVRGYDKTGIVDVDLYKRWKNIDEEDGRGYVEEILGEMESGDLADIDFDIASQYAMMDSDVLIQLRPYLWERIQAYNLEDVFQVDMGTVPMFSDMMRNGMKIDPNHFRELSGSLKQRMEVINTKIDKIAHRHVNLASPVQVCDLLIDKGVFKEPQTTNAKHLEKFRTKHEAVDLILQHRGLHKLDTTYVDVLPKLMDQDNRVHTTIRTTRVITGRPCIAKGTKILMSDYTMKNIEDVKKGDKVECYDNSLRRVSKRVIWSGRTSYEKIIRLHWQCSGSHGYTDLTPDHKVRLADGNYDHAIYTENARVMGPPGYYGGTWRYVEGVERLNKWIDVYNIEVEDFHNFIACGHSTWEFDGICVSNSSHKPNLLNQPKKGEDGRAVRAGFVAREGCVLLEADYSQIELRLLAHMAKDKNMIECFLQNDDLHANTAKLMYKMGGYNNWDELDKYTKEAKRRNAKCFHPDTEVLTKTGWKKIINLSYSDEIIQAIPVNKRGVKLEWVKPLFIGTMVNKWGFLYHLKNEGIDLRVTPDHTMVGQWCSGNYGDVLPEKFNNVRYFPNAGLLTDDQENNSININEQMLRLAIATQADGSVYIRKSGDITIKFGFSKQRKIKRLRLLLQELHYKESIHRNGKNGYTTAFTLYNDVASKIMEYLDKDKTLSWNLLHFPIKYRQIILDETQYWDSCCQYNWKMYSYTTIIEKNVEILQAIASITNNKTRKSIRFVTNLNWNHNYKLSVKKQSKSRGENIETTKVNYSGLVSVLTVPSHYVLVRDGGIPVITKQCVNFGIAYGLSAYGLYRDFTAQNIKTTLPECEAFIKSWFDAYPQVYYWIDRIHAEAKRTGMIRDLFGRMRLCPEGKSANERVRAAGDRQAVNTPIQSSAQGIIKRAMVQLIPYYRDITEDGKYHCDPLLQIYDSLIFEISEELVPWTGWLIKDIMENVVKLRVPTPVDVKVGYNWRDVKELGV